MRSSARRTVPVAWQEFHAAWHLFCSLFASVSASFNLASLCFISLEKDTPSLTILTLDSAEFQKCFLFHLIPSFPMSCLWRCLPLLLASSCIILPYLVSTSCLPTHAYSHPLKASARRTQLLKNLQKGLVPQQKTTDPTDFKVCHRSSQVFNASVLLHFHLTCLWSLWAATAIIMWHHVTSRYLSTSFLHAHFRAAPTFYSTCWSNLEQGAQKRETENIGGKITQQNKKDIQRTSVSVT